MADDVLQVFSSFDNHFFTRDKTYERHCEADPQLSSLSSSKSPLAALDRNLWTLKRQIPCFVDSNGLIWFNSAEASKFLEAVDFILDTVTDINNQAASSASMMHLERTNHLIRRFVLRLNEEFHSIIQPPHGPTSEDYDGVDSNAYFTEGDEPIPVAKRIDAYDIVINALPPGSVMELNGIARQMVATVCLIGHESSEKGTRITW